MDVILVQPVDNMVYVTKNVCSRLTYLSKIWSCCWSQWPRGQDVGLQPLACWDWGFKSRWGHGHLSLMIIVCSQVEDSIMVWSLIQRSPTECCVSYSATVRPRLWRGLDPLVDCRAMEKKIIHDTVTRLHLFWPNKNEGKTEMSIITGFSHHIKQTGSKMPKRLVMDFRDQSMELAFCRSRLDLNNK